VFLIERNTHALPRTDDGETWNRGDDASAGGGDRRRCFEGRRECDGCGDRGERGDRADGADVVRDRRGFVCDRVLAEGRGARDGGGEGEEVGGGNDVWVERIGAIA